MGGGRTQGVGSQLVVAYQPLLVLLAALVAGVIADRGLGLEWESWCGLASAGWLGWLAAFRRRLLRGSTVLLLAAAGSTAAAWHHFCWRLYPETEIGRHADETPRPVCVRAVAQAAPRLQRRRSPYEGGETEESVVEVRLRSVRVAGSAPDSPGRDSVRQLRWHEASGRALLTVPGRLTGLRAGDLLEIRALISRPPRPCNPGEFDFADHERMYRRACRLRAEHPEAVRLAARRAWHAGRWLDSVRRAGYEDLVRYVGPERGELAAALLLGTRTTLGAESTESFLVTGTIHLLAISGMHVGILVWCVWIVGRTGLCSRRTTLLVAVVFVIAYALVTEARPPVVRAAVLVGIMCLGRLLGLRTLASNTLAAAGILVLVLNPVYLLQTGTQLSFLAVATLCCGGERERQGVAPDPLDCLLWRSRPWVWRAAARLLGSAWQLCWLTTRVSLVTTPLVLYRFHLFTPVGLLVNPLLCPGIAVPLFSGFGVLLTGRWFPPMATVLGRCCDLSLAMVEWCTARAEAIPGGHLWLPAPPGWWVALFYLLVTACFLTVELGGRHRPLLRGMLAVWLSLGGALVLWRPISNTSLDCTFVAVGHGTCVLFELPGGEVWLYDAGGLGSPTVACRRVSAVLWSRGIRKLDGVILSHADADHYNALPGLLERFSLKAVYVTPGMFRGSASGLQELRAALLEHQVAVRTVVAGQELDWPQGARLRVLHPPPAGVAGSDNANSAVVEVEYAGRRILMPGDLEEDGLRRLLALPALDCDLVMAPHHGSARSDPARFLTWSTPEWVIVSGGRHRHVRAASASNPYRSAAATVLHTAEDGAIRVRCTAQSLTVHSWRREPW
jgi:competence protein ComEC